MAALDDTLYRMSRIAPLESALLPHDLELTRRLGESARRHGVQLWAVGGAVRDALLGGPVLDIDLTSETPANELGPVLARELGGSVTSHSQFGTVKLRFDGRILDLATARSERYARPGDLPMVSPGTIVEDLARRDFSINAMAASLAPGSFGEVLDTEGGLRDLARKAVRALHERSFQDDAMRILRGTRYATRLGFHFDRRTRNWLQRDLGYMDTISPSRLRRELERMLEEEAPVPALSAAHRLGVLSAIHPAWGGQDVTATLRRVRRRALTPLALLGALVYSVPGSSIMPLCVRLACTARQRTVVDHVVRLRGLERQLTGARASAVDTLVGDAPDAAVEACAAVSADPAVRSKLSRHLERARTWRSPLNGNDLIALGIPPGPEVGQLLRLLRTAAFDGSVRTRQGAISLVGRIRQEREQ